MRHLATLGAAALALAGTASAQDAETIELTAADMDTVSAGVLDDLRLGVAIPISVVNAVDLTSAIGILSENITADGGIDAQSANVTGLDIGDYFDLSGMGGMTEAAGQ